MTTHITGEYGTIRFSDMLFSLESVVTILSELILCYVYFLVFKFYYETNHWKSVGLEIFKISITEQDVLANSNSDFINFLPKWLVRVYLLK